MAANELGFPAVALEYFRQSFTDAELVRRIRCPGNPVFVVVKNDCLAGVLIGSLPEGGVGTIIWLIVASGLRSLGFGKTLFEEACKAYSAMGCHKVKLTASTREAVKFYENLGMSIEGQHINHWWMLDFWSLGKLLP